MSETPEMVERVARAMAEAEGPDDGLRLERMARAAIEAMGSLNETTFALALHEIDERRGPQREGKQVFREFWSAVIAEMAKPASSTA